MLAFPLIQLKFRQETLGVQQAALLLTKQKKGEIMRETGGRHELKHYINRSDLIQLKSRLSCVMSSDENCDSDGGYFVQSLYFDNYNDKVLREKIDGVDQREKFRLRFYNNNTGFIRLEKKSKKKGLCFKESTSVSHDLCMKLLIGEFEALRENGDSLCMELYAKMQYELLRPKNIVEYRRDAFVFAAGNVRITLDYNIRSSMVVSKFLTPDYISVPIPEVFILEVKYDNFIPEIIRGLVTLSSRQQTAFSKYAQSRLI